MNKFGFGVVVCLVAAAHVLLAQSPATLSLRGVIKDPSGSLVPNAVVQLNGLGGQQNKTTGVDGTYAFSPLAAGKYNLRVTSPGFTTTQKNGIDLQQASVLDIQLTIADETQVLTVQDSVATVSVDPQANASALVLGEKELEALSDDPDELSQQLQRWPAPAPVERRTDLHRRFHWRTTSSEIVHTRNSHQLQSVLA